MNKIELRTEYITLGQLLKIADIINSGGEAKYYLEENKDYIFVDGVNEFRRGKKLYKGTIVKIHNLEFLMV